MKPLRYLKNIDLYKANKVKQANGSLMLEYNKKQKRSQYVTWCF